MDCAKEEWRQEEGVGERIGRSRLRWDGDGGVMEGWSDLEFEAWLASTRDSDHGSAIAKKVRRYTGETCCVVRGVVELTVEDLAMCSLTSCWWPRLQQCGVFMVGWWGRNLGDSISRCTVLTLKEVKILKIR